MSTFEEWVRAVLDAKLLAGRYRDPLLLPLIDALERVGEAFKAEPEYEEVMKLLEEARKLVSSEGGSSALLVTEVKSGGSVIIPTEVARKHGLKPGDALIRISIRGVTEEFRARVGKPSSALKFVIPSHIREKYNLREGDRVVVESITNLG